MKKSIKYAGIAAATLLTVAPIAAPVVSNVTTVKADASDAPADFQKVETAADDFKDAFGDVKASTLNSTNLGGLDLGNEVSYSSFVTTEFAKTLGGSDLGSGDAATDVLASNDRNAKVTVTAKQVGGSSITDFGDLTKILANNDMPEVEFTITLNYKDFDKNPAHRTATFTATKDDTTKLTQINASYTTPLTVALNSQTTAAELTSSANVKITDQNSNNVDFSNAAPTSNYYFTYNAALKDTGDNTVQKNSEGNASTDVIKNNKFVKAGTYYQAITLNAGDSLSQFITDYQNDPTSNPVYVNGKVASEGADFEITPGTAAVKADPDNNVAAKNATPATITFVRTVKVSASSAEWTTKDTTGVVTTKTDHAFYTLKDDEGNTVTNRALAKNTAWKTNAVRTDQNGNKQYRVGASEWIDANDVTFSDKATDNNGEGAYTDVKALNGKVTTAGPEGFYYPLYDDNGKMVTNRGVAGLSAWYTDKSAVNADGVTVYHVATGEWLQGTNVTYTAY